MNSEYRSNYRFGITDPNMIRGIGSARDVLAFFDALQMILDGPEREYPFLWSLRHKPVFGMDMLPLFEESQKMRRLMNSMPVTDELLTGLHLNVENTDLRIGSDSLAGVFEGVFKTLADDAPEYVRLCEDYPELNPLEEGSIRVGPVEPLVIEGMFNQLPLSAFDECDPPMWLRDEIFDERWYIGKI